MANVVEIVLTAVDKTKQGFTAPIKNLSDLSKAVDKVKPFFLTLEATAVAALAAMAKHAVNVDEEMGKAAQRAGTTSEAFSSLAYSGTFASLSAEQLQKSYKELSKLLVESRDNTSNASNAFREYGITVRSESGNLLSSSAVMLNVAEQFSKMEDGADKVTEAVKLFGRAGQDMIPFLNEGAEGIRKMQEEAVLFHQVVSTKTSKAASEFNDNLTKLKAIMQGVVNGVVEEFLPAAAEMLSAFVEWIKKTGVIEGAIGTLIDIFKTFAYVVKLVITAFSALSDIFTGIGTAIGYLASTVVDAFALIGGALGQGSAAIEELLKGNFQNAETIAHQSLAKIQTDALSLLKGIPAIGAALATGLKDAYDTLSKGPTAPTFGEHEGSDGSIMVEKFADQESQMTNIHKQNLWMRKLMDDAANEGQIASFMMLQDTERAAFEQGIEEKKQFIKQYADFYTEAHRGAFSYIAQAAQTLYQGIGNALTSIITGAQSAGEAFKQLGKAMIAMVMNFMAQRLVAFALEKIMAAVGLGLLKAAVITNSVAAAGLAAAWAPAATAAAIATFGGALTAGAGVPALMAANAAAGSAISLAGAIGGVAHAGATMIPEEATYLLQGGERVLAPEQNQDFTQFLANGGGNMVTAIINLDGQALGRGIGKISRDGLLEISARSVV
jgi:DNA-directed RNA polymerase subunit F